MDSITEIFSNGVFCKFVYWEQEWASILFPITRLIPTCYSKSSKGLILSCLDECECGTLVITKNVKLTCLKSVHTPLVKASHFGANYFPLGIDKQAIDKLSFFFRRKNRRIIEASIANNFLLLFLAFLDFLFRLLMIFGNFLKRF